MGKRSGVVDNERDITRLTDQEVAAEIDRCIIRRQLATSAYLRRSFASRLHWLTKVQTRRAAEREV
jgi:hypothetical protein